MRNVRIGFYQSCVLQWIIGAIAVFSAAMILSVNLKLSLIIAVLVATCDAVFRNFFIIMFLYPYYAYEKLNGNIPESMKKRMLSWFPKEKGMFEEKDSIWHNIVLFIVIYAIVGFGLYYFDFASLYESIIAGAIISGYMWYIDFTNSYILKLYHSHRLKKIS